MNVVGAGASATMIMGATAVGGTTFVAGLAVTDLISRRVSSMEEYMKTALAGSVDRGGGTGSSEWPCPCGSGFSGRGLRKRSRPADHRRGSRRRADVPGRRAGGSDGCGGQDVERRNKGRYRGEC